MTIADAFIIIRGMKDSYYPRLSTLHPNMSNLSQNLNLWEKFHVSLVSDVSRKTALSLIAVLMIWR
jgi:hypothetical protein